MENVSQYIDQKSIIDKYISGPCNHYTKSDTIPCMNDDWSYGIIDCGSGFNNNQYRCSKVDPHICPKIGNEKSKTVFDNAPRVKCEYKVSTFKKKEDIDTWIYNWGRDRKFNDVIMPNFCKIESHKCPNEMSECSRFISLDSEGKVCRAWAEHNVKLSNKVKMEICENGGEECLCINRENDPLYRDIVENLGSEVSEGTQRENSLQWWKPCTDNSKYIILEKNNNSCVDNTSSSSTSILSSKNSSTHKRFSNEDSSSLLLKNSSTHENTFREDTSIPKYIPENSLLSSTHKGSFKEDSSSSSEYATKYLSSSKCISDNTNTNKNTSSSECTSSENCIPEICERINDILGTKLKNKYSIDELKSKINCNLKCINNNTQSSNIAMNVLGIIITIILIILVFLFIYMMGK